MKEPPKWWKLHELIKHASTCSVEIDGEWVPCRPIGYQWFFPLTARLRCAWLVFTGKCDAVEWPKGQ